jgi:hypothetical protein
MRAFKPAATAVQRSLQLAVIANLLSKNLPAEPCFPAMLQHVLARVCVELELFGSWGTKGSGLSCTKLPEGPCAQRLPQVDWNHVHVLKPDLTSS